MSFDLPPTSREQAPQFLDAAQCQDWRAKLPPTLPIQAQAQLLRQMHLLNRYTLSGETRLDILETLREPIRQVQGESAKKFAGKPLPLAPPEQAAFDSALALWQAQLTGYLRCLDAIETEPALQARAAMIGQRALAAAIDAYIDLMRAGIQPAEAHWRTVHRLYARIEQLGAADRAVEDALRTERTQTPTNAYAEQVLLAAAGLHELPLRQQAWAMRWARRWGAKLAIGNTLPELDGRTLPLCVDLDSAQPPGFKPFSGAGARWLDTAELRKSLKSRLQRLGRGGPEDTPAQLGLGEECTLPACETLLRRLYPRWVKGGVPRRFDRRALAGTCRFVVGVEAVHYYISGHRPFKVPGHLSGEELRRQREELATFGRIAERFEDEYSRNHGYQLENWEVLEDWGLLDQSSGGLRLKRSLKQSGGRLAIGQLVAVQPGETAGLMLGTVCWAQVIDEGLAAGIQLFPGKPWPVAIRGTGLMANREPYRPGFLLPEVAALEQPQSVVLPPGSFKPERILELWTPEGSAEVKLKTLLERGSDFERVACVEMDRK